MKEWLEDACEAVKGVLYVGALAVVFGGVAGLVVGSMYFVCCVVDRIGQLIMGAF